MQSREGMIFYGGLSFLKATCYQLRAGSNVVLLMIPEHVTSWTQRLHPPEVHALKP